MGKTIHNEINQHAALPCYLFPIRDSLKKCSEWAKAILCTNSTTLSAVSHAGSLNPRPCTCQASIPPLSSTPTSWFFKTGSFYEVHSGLQLAMQPRLALNSQPSCLSPLSVGTRGIYCHACQKYSTILLLLTIMVSALCFYIEQ